MTGNNSINFCDSQMYEVVQCYFENKIFKEFKGTASSYSQDNSLNGLGHDNRPKRHARV